MNDADLKRYQDAKLQLRTLVNTAIITQTKTQKEILTERSKIVSNVLAHNKKTPRYLAASLNDYFDGFYEALVKDKTVFLYNVGGQLYKLGKSSQSDINLPAWDTLPREQWDMLGSCGGSYWRKTLNVFFDNSGV